MEMRTCFSCSGDGEKVLEEDQPAEACDLCEGKGYIADGCYCAAREPFECCCGGWDDVDLDEWYGGEE